MLTSEALMPIVASSFERVLRHLVGPDGDVPQEVKAQGKAYARLKAERGKAPLAEALGLHEAELAGFDAAVRDVDRTLDRLDPADPHTERNLVIALTRLVTWFETVGQRVPTLALEAPVEALISEDVARKEVRALELIVRSLVTESYGGQDGLVAGLKETLGDQVVAKWQRSADAGDLLSGCTFSDLATLFANKSEFDRYRAIYGETNFLTFLKQRRRTLQSFLDDVRRIRNLLAHHKRVTPAQLALLDTYYEEIVAPVQVGFDEGATTVDPGVHLDVSKEALDGYFANLEEDVRSVKDDLGELRTEVMASLGEVRADTHEIRKSTRRIDRKVLMILGGVAVLIVAAILLLGQGEETQEGVEAARAAGEGAEAAARETADVARGAAARTEEAASRVEGAADEAHEAAARAETVAGRTEEAVERTEAVAERTEDAVERTEAVAGRTEDAAERTEAVAGRTEDAAERTEAVAGRTEEAVERTEAVAERTAEAVEDVAETLEELRAGFAALTQTGGIIADAKRPQEHYHNARLYEQRGDQAKALQSFRAYFAFPDLEFVDPHLRYQALLKLQNGMAGTREIYHAMKKSAPNPVTEFAWFLLLDGDARTDGLRAYVEAHPDFAPAYYALSRDFSVARLGSQSLADKREEKTLLKRFLALSEEGDYLRWYLDQSVAAVEIEDAKERFAALETLSDAMLQNPVTMRAQGGSTAWTLVFSIPDTVKEIFYRVGPDGEYRSTGFMEGVTSHAGLPLPLPMTEVDKRQPKTTIYIKYIDPRDREHGPFELVFDPESAALTEAKSMLELTRKSWVGFRDWDDKLLVYFSQIVASRGAVRELRYGVDVEIPDRVFPLAPTGTDNPHDVGVDVATYISVPLTTRFVTVQLTYKDGTTSEITRFDR